MRCKVPELHRSIIFGVQDFQQIQSTWLGNSSSVQMAADPNMNFGVFPQSFCNQRVVSFQSGAVNSSAGIIPGSAGSSSEVNGIPGLVLPGNAVMMNNPAVMIQQCNSPSNGFIEQGHGVKHGSTLAVHWSYHELAVLRDGLDKFAGEPNIMKYIKIAARLPDKTVRDVAMRCQWMMKKENGKRRKHEEYYAGKKLKDGKEMATDSSLWVNSNQLQPRNQGSYSIMMANANHSNQFSHEALVIDNATRHLLEENAQLINRISANLDSFQVHNNIDLFNRMRNNIAATLDSMSQTPGIMSRMPPLPVTVNEKLVDALVVGATMAHAPGSSHPKDEPRCW